MSHSVYHAQLPCILAGRVLAAPLVCHRPSPPLICKRCEPRVEQAGSECRRCSACVWCSCSRAGAALALCPACCAAHVLQTCSGVGRPSTVPSSLCQATSALRQMCHRLAKVWLNNSYKLINKQVHTMPALHCVPLQGPCGPQSRPSNGPLSQLEHSISHPCLSARKVHQRVTSLVCRWALCTHIASLVWRWLRLEQGMSKTECSLATPEACRAGKVNNTLPKYVLAVASGARCNSWHAHQCSKPPPTASGMVACCNRCLSTSSAHCRQPPLMHGRQHCTSPRLIMFHSRILISAALIVAFMTMSAAADLTAAATFYESSSLTAVWRTGVPGHWCDPTMHPSGLNQHAHKVLDLAKAGVPLDVDPEPPVRAAQRIRNVYRPGDKLVSNAAGWHTEQRMQYTHQQSLIIRTHSCA